MSYIKSSSTAVLRGIVRELRLSNPNMKPISKTYAFSYLMNEYRCHQVTERRTCKSPDELLSMAKAYNCYLQSLREHQELLKKFHNKGERSVEETAHLLGFSLPHNQNKEPTSSS